MLTGMTEGDWALVVKVFGACQSRRGDKAVTIGCFSRRCISSPSRTSPGAGCRSGSATGTASGSAFAPQRQRRVRSFLRGAGRDEPSAHLVQMFDSTVVRAHVSAAGAKGGRKTKRSAARAAASPRRSTSKATSTASRSASTSPAARRATAASSSCSSKSVPTSRRARR